MRSSGRLVLWVADFNSVRRVLATYRNPYQFIIDNNLNACNPHLQETWFHLT